jgi:hypothetical protein
MFGPTTAGVGLVAEETDRNNPFGGGFDDLCFLITEDELATGWPEDDRYVIPDLNAIPAGPFLAVLLEHVDRSKLNGFDLVRVLQARERQIAHTQAGYMADAVEISYAAPGDAGSDPMRLQEAFEFASDEIRAALTLTRRAAEYRLDLATDVVERLPRVFELLSQGLIDVFKARVFVDGTCHVSEETARSVVAELADVAPRLTTGQLRARIRRLCVQVDPEEAEKREQTAHEDRRLVIEATEDGVANLYLLGLKMGDARAIGRRVNGHMLSLKKEDRSGRTHDQLRHDITRDLLLGEAAAGGGRGLVDIRVPVSTLDGDSQPGEIGGLGPVTAETARHVVAFQPEADHQITLTDDNGNPTHVYTLSRQATKQIRKSIQAIQPTCSFPGCRMPAVDCDLDHYDPWNRGGETSTTNLGPKCRHDHQLKDHGWTHRRKDRRDIWTSPLGHTYLTQGQSP